MAGFFPNSRNKSKSPSGEQLAPKLSFNFSSASVNDVFLKNKPSPRLALEPNAPFDLSSASIEEVFMKAKPSPKIVLEPTAQFNFTSTSVKDVFLKTKPSPKLTVVESSTTVNGNSLEAKPIPKLAVTFGKVTFVDDFPRQSDLTTTKTLVEEFEEKVAALEEANGNHLKEIEVLRKDKQELRKDKQELEEAAEQLAAKLRERVRCLCLEVPRSGPVAMWCPNGHYICQACRKTDYCPTCRAPYMATSSRSLLSETVIENIEHECTFPECEELFFLSSLADHERQCEVRLVACPGCGVKVCLRDLLQKHVMLQCSKVARDVISLETEPLQRIRISITDGQLADPSLPCPSFTGKAQAWAMPVKIFFKSGHHFFLSAKRSQGFLEFSVLLAGLPEDCHKWRVELTAHGDSDRLMHAQLYRSQGPPCSLDLLEQDPGHLVIRETGLRKILQEESFMVAVKVSENNWLA